MLGIHFIWGDLEANGPSTSGHQLLLEKPECSLAKTPQWTRNAGSETFIETSEFNVYVRLGGWPLRFSGFSQIRNIGNYANIGLTFAT